MNIVWFKRDLRVVDHEALAMASKRGPVLPLYIFEPMLWEEPDMSRRHHRFLKACLCELNASLEAMGQKLIIKNGHAVDVLESIHKRHQIQSLWSHQETWNGWTYTRDKAVNHWCQTRNISWHQPTQNGVIRCLSDRDGWSAKWYGRMKKPVLEAPEALQSIEESSEPLPDADALCLQANPVTTLQKGGRPAGLELLSNFLHERGEGYSKEMSSPVTAFDSCSRLSAHLAFGTVSIREVSHACERRRQEIKQLPRGMKGKWPSTIRSFSGRLRWHCHFMQKLEDEPRIEFENMHPDYDGLRENGFNELFFEAWKAGKTGYPMVDACMRALTSTGWLNFRMRAMIMSFASYHLWLHWRRPALHLAKLFTDYEPGIHYSQAQMQSGTTGINTIRIYNPIKQGVDHDPEGTFIRHWIPELRSMDQAFIHTPWLAVSQMGAYPMPVIDEKEGRKAAAGKLYGLRKKSKTHKKIAEKIVSKHGSRKSGLPRRTGHLTNNLSKQEELPL